MKRKLVNYEVFEKMKEGSLSAIANELLEAQEHLARTLGLDALTLESFDESSVIYAKQDGTFLRAEYSLDGDALTFNELEEIVIDEASESNRRREVVKGLLSAILEDRDADAFGQFNKYMELASAKYVREGTLLPQDGEALDEAHVRLYGTRGKHGPKVFVRKGAKDPAKSAAAKKGHRLHSASYKAGGKKRKSQITAERSRRAVNKSGYARLHALSGGKQYGRKKKHMNEWLTLVENVFKYADVVENGYVLAESLTRQDEKGNLVSVRIPSEKARNEAKIVKMQFNNMIKQDNPKVMRESGLRLGNDAGFGKAVVELKRNNNLSDTSAVEDNLGALVKNHPSVLFLTQPELAKAIGEALEASGVVNFDDKICNFLAEGILRTAQSVYESRVSKLFSLANVTETEAEDTYPEFQKAMEAYFPTLDETIAQEMKVFEDLYNAVLDVRKLSLESRNDELRSEASDVIGELEHVLSGRQSATIELAVDVAEWLQDIVEANFTAPQTWDVVKTPYQTVTGDHPLMAKNATTPAHIPADYDHLNPDIAPQLNGDGTKIGSGDETRYRSWGNKGGKDVWPDLNNPYIPEPKGRLKILGAEEVPSDDQWGHESKDTWPNLNNPYIPKALIPRQLVSKNTVE